MLIPRNLYFIIPFIILNLNNIGFIEAFKIANYNCIEFKDNSCVDCIFPYNISKQKGLCVLDSSKIIDNCKRSFISDDSFYCFECENEYFFSEERYKCEECSNSNNCIKNIIKVLDSNESTDTSITEISTICNDTLCSYCSINDPSVCLKCEDKSMVLWNDSCECPLGTYFDKSDKICYSCKEDFGDFCKKCNYEECLECISPYCRLIPTDSGSTCLCNFQLITSCKFFNSQVDSIYYDPGCFCFNSKGECVVKCSEAYNDKVFACDSRFGYYFLNDYSKEDNPIKESCLKHQYYSSNDNACYDCDSNCSMCNDNNICLVDSNDNKLNCPSQQDYAFVKGNANSINQYCINCLSIDDTRKRVKCAKSSVTSGSLCSFSYNINCAICDGNEGCLVCYDGYFLYTGQISIFHLKYYSNNDIFYNSTSLDNTNSTTSTNNSSDRITLYQGQCYKCSDFFDPNCVRCSETECLSCFSGFVVNQLGFCTETSLTVISNTNNKSDEACFDKGCLTCPQRNKCLICKQGYYLSSFDFTCFNFNCNIANCQQCGSNNVCSQCKLFYLLDRYKDSNGILYSSCELSLTVYIIIILLFLFVIFILVSMNIGIFGYRKWYLFNEYIPFIFAWINKKILKKNNRYKKKSHLLSNNDTNSTRIMLARIKSEEKALEEPLTIKTTKGFMSRISNKKTRTKKFLRNKNKESNKDIDDNVFKHKSSKFGGSYGNNIFGNTNINSEKSSDTSYKFNDYVVYVTEDEVERDFQYDDNDINNNTLNNNIRVDNDNGNNIAINNSHVEIIPEISGCENNYENINNEYNNKNNEINNISNNSSIISSDKRSKYNSKNENIIMTNKDESNKEDKKNIEMESFAYLKNKN